MNSLFSVFVCCVELLCVFFCLIIIFNVAHSICYFLEGCDFGLSGFCIQSTWTENS